MFTRSLGTGLLAGRDGWLFWIGRNRYVLRLFRRGPVAAWCLWRWQWLVARRATRCRKLGARFVQVVAPDTLSVYGHKLVAKEVSPDASFALRLGERLREAGRGMHWVELVPAFRAGREAEDLCLHTDTHFTPAGYRLAYRLICDAFGVSPAAHVLQPGPERQRIDTDLGSKLHPPMTEECERHDFVRSAQRVEENSLVRLQERLARPVPGVQGGSRIVLRNDSAEADPRRVVAFGDSYLFHETGLGSMLAESFREVHLLWSPALDYGYLARVGPDLVIAEIAERFVRRIPQDGVDIEALADRRAAAAARTYLPVAAEQT